MSAKTTARYGDLQDKVVLITGGGAGIGAATAKAFLDQGARVAVVDVAQDGLDKVVADLDVERERIIAITADVSKEDDVKRYVDTTVEKLGRIDIFFNNAGIGGPVKPIVETDPRYAEVEDIANLVLFLGSEQSSFITGSEHRVDGGMLS